MTPETLVPVSVEDFWHLAHRLPRSELVTGQVILLTTGFFPGAPDLAVEGLSPDDRPGETAAKVSDYLEGGCAAVWVVDPEGSAITVHTREVAMKYGASEVIDGALSCPVSKHRSGRCWPSAPDLRPRWG